MKSSLFEACKAYVDAQTRLPPPAASGIARAVTISRETGAGAVTIGQLAVKILHDQQARDEVPWTVFDRQLVERILQDHKLPTRISQFMPEDTTSEIREAVEEILGLHPSDWTLVHYTTDTILRLAHAGNVIIVGRGANIITAHLKHVLHVRLVAPLEKRIAHVQEYYKITRRAAMHLIRKTDRARTRYVKHNFSARNDDPIQYHLVINTAQTGFELAAQLIVEAVKRL